MIDCLFEEYQETSLRQNRCCSIANYDFSVILEFYHYRNIYRKSKSASSDASSEHQFNIPPAQPPFLITTVNHTWGAGWWFSILPFLRHWQFGRAKPLVNIISMSYLIVLPRFNLYLILHLTDTCSSYTVQEEEYDISEETWNCRIIPSRVYVHSTWG